MKLPSVSIVICSYNGASRISATLQSIAEQDYPKSRTEVIVVDDGSDDNTSDIANAHNVTVVRHEKNMGIPNARNAGLDVAHGEIVCYLDDDIIASSNWISEIVLAFHDKKSRSGWGTRQSIQDRSPV